MQENKRSSFFLLWFLAFVGILILGMVVYVLRPSPKQSLQSKIAPTAAVVTPTQIPITWMTYTNAQFGYSIPYPSNWTIQKLGQTSQTLDTTIFNPPPGNAHPITIKVDAKNSPDSQVDQRLVDAERSVTINSINVTEQVVHDSAGNQTVIAIFPLSDKVLSIKANSKDGELFNHMIGSLTVKK